MFGYICDRCGTFDPGEDSQKDGHYPKSGWTTLIGLGHVRHLCPTCTSAVTNFVSKQQTENNNSQI